MIRLTIAMGDSIKASHQQILGVIAVTKRLVVLAAAKPIIIER